LPFARANVAARFGRVRPVAAARPATDLSRPGRRADGAVRGPGNSPPAALDRLSTRARGHRILARPPQSPPRAPPVHARWRRVEQHAALSMTDAIDPEARARL